MSLSCYRQAIYVLFEGKVQRRPRHLMRNKNAIRSGDATLSLPPAEGSFSAMPRKRALFLPVEGIPFSNLQQDAMSETKSKDG